MSELTWDEFPEISPAQWKQKIQAGLKGADYNKTLVRNTGEGIDVKPFYTSEDTGLAQVYPHRSGWKICQHIHVSDARRANAEALDALKRGAESLLFVIPSEKSSIEALLHGIDLSVVPVYIQPEFLSPGFIRALGEFVPGKNNLLYLNTDIIGNLARSGNWYSGPEKDYGHLAEILDYCVHFQSAIAVDAGLYQNAGAHTVQQLAYALAHANEYCNFIAQPDAVSDRFRERFTIHFKIATGSNYFFDFR